MSEGGRSAAMVVAIDGPSGVGKSSTARRVAGRLGLAMLDTGAMYRSVALACLDRGVDLGDADAVVSVLDEVDLDLRMGPSGATEVLLDGEPVGDRIRTPEVSEASSRVAIHPAVRTAMVALQQRWGRAHGAVVEGRDIGTVVFPETPHKFFLDARPEIRARRRFRDLEGSGLTEAEVLEDLMERDARDRDRESSPLRIDDSYRRVDTSDLDPEQVVEAILEAIEAPRPIAATKS